ncbi:MAG TPA: GIY-YIG nuclease family protein [Candidatus Paceibacterota bacterium]
MYNVYIIKSRKNKKYYIGYTSNQENRIKKHNSGENISTKYGAPWELIYSERFENKREAWLGEKQIKKFKGGEAFKKLIGLID